MTTLPLAFALVIAAQGSSASPSQGAKVTVIRDDAGVVAQALALVNHPEQKVILFDPEQYDPAHRRKLERLAAFVFAERTEIYLNLRGRAYREASKGGSHGAYILAAIFAHEIEHLQGRNERAALVEERGLVYKFMKEGHIPPTLAQEHLQNVWEQGR